MRHAFEAALEEAERSAPDAPAPPPIRFAPDLTVEPASGGHSLWELAAAWTPEADPPPPPPPRPAPPRPSAAPEDVARELRLNELKTAQDIARARRAFMWENHPDRRDDLDPDLANRRVAIANMLLDRLAAYLTRPRRR